MKIINTTNIPEAKLKEIIAFIKPNGLPTHTINVRLTNSSSSIGAGGKCYSQGTDYTDRPTIIVNLSRNETGYPYFKSYKYKVVVERFQKPNKITGALENWKRKQYVDDPTNTGGGYIDHLCLSREEALVHTLAHEFRHFWQSNHLGKRGKVWGARGKYSEKDASAYGIRKMREWRHIHSPREVYPHEPWSLTDSN